MTDIERLRRIASYCRNEDVSVVIGAADEIERLLAENKRLWEGLDAMVNPKPDGNASMRVRVGIKP